MSTRSVQPVRASSDPSLTLTPFHSPPHSLDRLISLLETGSTPQIKQTAAKQLGQIATRSFGALAAGGPASSSSSSAHAAAAPSAPTSTPATTAPTNEHDWPVVAPTSVSGTNGNGNGADAATAAAQGPSDAADEPAQSLGVGLDSDDEWKEVLGLVGRVRPPLSLSILDSGWREPAGSEGDRQLQPALPGSQLPAPGLHQTLPG